ncbi:MAG: hypothetical protein AAGC46_10210, partial [Solirubrobacteraceae bacterium]|nr:hypothetical protein [Patulibacter sp.]
MQGYVDYARTSDRVRTRRRPRDERTRQQPRHLAALLEARAFVIHDCPVGSGLPSVDHVAVGSSGVWVIVSRRVSISRVQLRRSLVGPTKLLVGSTDRSELLALADRQRKAVCETLADQPDVPVHTAITFAGGQYPLFGTLSTAGHRILPPTALADEVSASGPLSRAE